MCVGAVATAVVPLGDWRRCLANIDAMVAHGVPLDQRSVHAALYSCGRTGTMTALLVYYSCTISLPTCVDNVTVTTACSSMSNANWRVITAAALALLLLFCYSCCIAYVAVLCLTHTLVL
jgi:hypothetical protein